MISASLSGGIFNPSSRFRIAAVHSGMFDSCDTAYRFDKLPPASALLLQNLLALPRKPVISPPSLICLFDPPPLNPAAILEAIEQWIERCYVEMQLAIRAALDKLPDVIPVARLVLDKRKDQQLGAALLPFMLHPGLHICRLHICIRTGFRNISPLSLWET